MLSIDGKFVNTVFEEVKNEIHPLVYLFDCTLFNVLFFLKSF
jgi:hypothetical protein